MLAASKILDNMEIGHNVMHGQYDWMGDPALTGRNFEWDSACPSDQWRHSHNYMHHTHTNIVGMDRDIGYGILRMSEDQRWRALLPRQPGLRLPADGAVPVRRRACTSSRPSASAPARSASPTSARSSTGIWKKVKRQTLKDYVAFPLLAGPFAPWVFAGNMTANLIRNVWSYAIIFCGHFPEGTQEFTIEETAERDAAACGTSARCSARRT